MGGIRNYEELFFTPEYETHYPEDKILIERLKDFIAEQIPLLSLCVQIHKQLIAETLQPLQSRLEECFAVVKLDVEEKYGKKVRAEGSPRIALINTKTICRIAILNSRTTYR